AKILADSHEIATLHGRIMLGILIIQDILIVLALPLLNNLYSIFSLALFGGILFKGLGLFCIALVVNRFISKKILDHAAKTKEVLFFTAVSSCFIFMGLAYALGFSIAIGAFIGGLALAQFPYNIEIFGEMRSLRDFFAVIFFTTLGMQLNLTVMYSMFVPFIVFLLLIILAKPAILTLIYLLLGYGGRTSSTVGLGLGQASEFTFIIAAQGLLLGHLTGQMYSLILSIMVVSMVVTPYFINHHSSIYSFFRRTKVSHRRMRPHKVEKLEKPPEKPLERHVVVFGAGMTGMKVIDYLKRKKERFVVLDHDPDVVKKLNKEGVHCFYGETDNEDLLLKLGLYKAKMAIATIPDIPEACFAIKKAKRFNPKIKILARATSKREEEELRQAGADYIVIPKVVCAAALERSIGHFLRKA
ncbi:MAG: cation:proton antiporter, partial [Candidatus Aenigmatarchaeota archaeon]